MIDKKIRRFELNEGEALTMVGDYINNTIDPNHTDLKVVKINFATTAFGGGLVIEVEVEG